MVKTDGYVLCERELDGKGGLICLKTVGYEIEEESLVLDAEGIQKL